LILDYTLADNTIACIFNGPMDTEAINTLRDQILKKLEIHEKINIYLEDQGIQYFTLYSVLQGIIFPLQHHKRFDKVAMVTDRGWIHLLSAINSSFIDASIKNFTSEERLEAMAWITSYS